MAMLMPPLSRRPREDDPVVGPTGVGVVLAAGAGRRLGHDAPKPLVTDAAGVTWLERSIAALRGGGAREVYVVVGADAAAVEAAVPPGCRTVFATDWAEGMGASLRAGLTAVERDCPTADAVVVMLVDTPGVGADVVRRLTDRATPEALARAVYDGVPGHPVVVGRRHWRGVMDVAAGDRGARDYLSAAEVELVECGDVGSGDDIDTPEALGAWSRQADHP
jgi:CTP:molybdopterin cytidylyltransferase MocA